MQAHGIDSVGRPHAVVGASQLSPSSGGRTILCVLDTSAEPLTGREPRHRRTVLRLAGALSHGGAAEVIVCPWHQARLRSQAVTIAGPVLLAGGGRLVPVIVSERAPAIMTFFPR
jgi:hypothetical protein